MLSAAKHLAVRPSGPFQLAIIISVVIALGVACGGGELRTISGSIILYDDGPFGAGWETDKACYGTGGYDDVNEGAQVVVKDSGGQVIGAGGLGPGLAVGEPTSSRRFTDFCVFLFEVAALPDSEFYSVEVSHRGELTYSATKLEADGWEVVLSLGQD